MTKKESQSVISRDCQKLLGPNNDRTAQCYAANVRNHDDDNDDDETMMAVIIDYHGQ